VIQVTHGDLTLYVIASSESEQLEWITLLRQCKAIDGLWVSSTRSDQSLFIFHWLVRLYGFIIGQLTKSSLIS